MNTFKTYFFLFVLSLGLIATGCVDNDFDEPENTFSISDEDVISIAEVLSYIENSTFATFDETNLGESPVYIKATINSDDASGNFYKTVTFQDSTGALSIIPDRNELNAEFPTGNTIYVKLQGLTLTYDANLPRLGYSLESGRLQRIPDILVNDFLIAGSKGDEIVPEVITISEFKGNPKKYYNKLIQLENVEFSSEYANVMFADPNNIEGPETVNTILNDCDNNEIILRNSGFSDFASELTPILNGSVTAVASVFNDDLQLFIRDLNDIEFTQLRCDGSGGQTEDELSIKDIQDQFHLLGVDKAGDGFITGVVISDKNAGQVDKFNAIIQNGDVGIVVRFVSAHPFELGDKIKVYVSFQEVSEYNGILQLNKIPLFNAISEGNGDLPEPRTLSIDEIKLNINKYESTRVIVENAVLSGANTFAGELIVDDGTETIEIFTWSDAIFANDPVPSGEVDVVAIVSEYQGEPQLILNSSSDIIGGIIIPVLNFDFENYSDGDPINKDGWSTIATKGNRTWISTSFSGDRFAECEAYQDTNPETEAWMITPTIDTDEKSIFSFQSAQAYWKHQGLSVWVSSDFDDISNANWTKIDEFRLANENDDNFKLIDSEEVDLKDYLSGKVRVGFKYEGTSASNTTKVRIDNVKLR